MMQGVKDVFGTADNLVFSFMLLLSAAIGIYYAYVDRKKKNTQEYLMGGRSLSVFPVAMSSWHGFLSAITLLGVPSEVYQYGTQYIIMSLTFLLVIPATAIFYVPVYYNLGLTSAYEYLGIRFHRYMRTFGSAIFFIHMMMYMPIILYAPALALSEVTGTEIWIAICSTGLVCTFYTSIGGVKAVVWTDCLQSIIMLGVVLLAVIKGVFDLGGLNVVWERSFNSTRIEVFRFDTDPTIRHTFMSLMVGGYILWMGNFAASQSMIQRYLTVRRLRDAQSVVWINLPACVFFIVLSCFAGLVIYAHYWDCDPIGTKVIQAPDQLFPRFVMESFGKYPGLPGLFVAGVYSGAISTMATGVNSLATTTLEDFVKVFISEELTEQSATTIGKIMTLTLGLIAVALTFVADKLGGILQAANTAHSVIGGPMLGVFTLGIFFPFANAWGAGIGLFSGITISMWLGIGSFVNQLPSPKAPLSYSGCIDLYYNATGFNTTGLSYLPVVETNESDVFYSYRISYIFLGAVGFVPVIAIGIFISLLTGCNNEETMDEKLFTPIVVWIYKNLFRRKFKTATFNNEDTINKMNISLKRRRKSSISENGEDSYKNKSSYFKKELDSS